MKRWSTNFIHSPSSQRPFAASVAAVCLWSKVKQSSLASVFCPHCHEKNVLGKFSAQLSVCETLNCLDCSLNPSAIISISEACGNGRYGMEVSKVRKKMPKNIHEHRKQRQGQTGGPVFLCQWQETPAHFWYFECSSDEAGCSVSSRTSYWSSSSCTFSS